jgi:hypothetical protein
LAHKISIHFFDDREVRAVWDDEKSKWWFPVVDIVGILRDESAYDSSSTVVRDFFGGRIYNLLGRLWLVLTASRKR